MPKDDSLSWHVIFYIFRNYDPNLVQLLASYFNVFLGSVMFSLTLPSVKHIKIPSEDKVKLNGGPCG